MREFESSRIAHQDILELQYDRAATHRERNGYSPKCRTCGDERFVDCDELHDTGPSGEAYTAAVWRPCPDCVECAECMDTGLVWSPRRGTVPCSVCGEA